MIGPGMVFALEPTSQEGQMRACETCGQTIPRNIRAGDFIEDRTKGKIGVVRRVMSAPLRFDVTVVGEGQLETWYDYTVTLLHGFFRITERL
jgi:hypothetical protein